MKTHYHVIVNMAGYMPESDPIICRTKREAQESALWEAEAWRDSLADCEHDTRKVYGNKRDGYVIDDPKSPYYIPTYISIDPCTEPECLEETEY